MPSVRAVDSQKSGRERRASGRMSGRSVHEAKTGRIRAGPGASGAAAPPVVGWALLTLCRQRFPCLHSRASFV